MTSNLIFFFHSLKHYFHPNPLLFVVVGLRIQRLRSNIGDHPYLGLQTLFQLTLHGLFFSASPFHYLLHPILSTF